MIPVTNELLTATPAKLRDGSWGARVLAPSAPETGARIKVQARSGKTWAALVAHVLWSGEDRDGRPVHLCATARVSDDVMPRRSSRRASGGRCRECHGPITHAPHCRAQAGYCGSCAYDCL